MPTIGPDPEPLKETIVYTGENLRQLQEWAQATADHYEVPSLQTPNVGAPDNDFRPVINGLQIEVAGEVGFDERTKQFTVSNPQDDWVDVNGPVPRERQFDQGPEILAHDHPLTVAEVGFIRGAAAARGVEAPSSFSTEFAQRRAQQLFPLPTELQASLNRHPAGHALSAYNPTDPGNITRPQGPGRSR